MLDLFADAEPWQEPLAPGAVILRRFALSRAGALLAGINEVTAASPFRHMVTPGGYTMSVAMANWAGRQTNVGMCMLRTIPRQVGRGLPCLRFSRHFVTRLPWRRIILTSVLTPV